MQKNIFVSLVLLAWMSAGMNAQTADDKLTGTPIGSSPSVNYSTGQKTTTVNTYANAFDGRLDTYFASYDRSYTWAGLDLETPHVITRVGWSPRNERRTRRGTCGAGCV